MEAMQHKATWQKGVAAPTLKKNNNDKPARAGDVEQDESLPSDGGEEGEEPPRSGKKNGKGKGTEKGKGKLSIVLGSYSTFGKQGFYQGSPT